MCIEINTRYRHCSHATLLRWDYCATLTPRERQPATGRSCRRYKLRYKESTDNSGCFDCALAEVAGWSAATSPTVSGFPERSPTVSSFLSASEGSARAIWSPPVSPTFMGTPTFFTFGSATGMLGDKGDRRSKESDVSVVASDAPLTPGAPRKDWRPSGDSKESQEDEHHHDEASGRGLKSWFKKKFKAREGYNGALGFQMMDA